MPETSSNLTFGGPKRNRLFICATTPLYSALLNINGAPVPRPTHPTSIHESVTKNAESETGELWLGFIGHSRGESAEALRAFEDAVLTLLPRYGASAIVRAQRHEREPVELPTEIHILYFPSRYAYQGFLDDPDRIQLVNTIGDVFSAKTVVELYPPSFGSPSPVNHERADATTPHDDLPSGMPVFELRPKRAARLRALPTAMRLMGYSCIAIGIAHFLLGVASVPGERNANSTIDSRERFYAAIFVGFGFAWVGAAKRTPVSARNVRWLAGILLLGGIGRLISIATSGWPHWFQAVLTAVELVLPIVYLWLAIAAEQEPGTDVRR